MTIEELKQERRWILTHGKEVKDLKDQKAAVTSQWQESKMWVTYDEAISMAKMQGHPQRVPAFVCGGEYCGIDLDHVVMDGEIVDDNAYTIYEMMDSYSEVSTSGTGIHIICKVDPTRLLHKGIFNNRGKDKGGKETTHVEVYDGDRGSYHYIVLTGLVYCGKSEIEERTEQVNELFNLFYLDKTPIEKREQVPAVGSSYSHAPGSYADEAISMGALDRLLDAINPRLDLASDPQRAWYACLHAYKDAGGSYSHAQEWSRRAGTKEEGGNYDPADWINGRCWNSDRKPGSATLGTLIYWAGRYGYHYHPAVGSTPVQGQVQQEAVSEVAAAEAESLDSCGWMGVFFEELQARAEQPIISTGFPYLDKVIGGGLGERCYITGAIPGIGKTAYYGQIVDYIAAHGHKAIYFNYEMSDREMGARSLSRLLWQSAPDKMREIEDELTDKVKHEGKYAADDPIYVDLFPSAGEIGMAQNWHTPYPEFAWATGKREWDYDDHAGKRMLSSWARKELTRTREIYMDTIAPNLWYPQHCGQSGEEAYYIVKKYIDKTGEIPVVFFDYLQKMKGTDTRIDALRAINSSLDWIIRIKRDLHCPVMVLSAFNRETYKDDGYYTTTMSSYKESGDIEYHFDLIFGYEFQAQESFDKIKKIFTKERFSQMEKEAEIPRKMRLKVLKARECPGAGHRINYDYYSRVACFFETGEAQ